MLKSLHNHKKHNDHDDRVRSYQTITTKVLEAASTWWSLSVLVWALNFGFEASGFRQLFCTQSPSTQGCF